MAHYRISLNSWAILLCQCGTEWASLGSLPEPFLTSLYLPALLSTGLAHLVPIFYPYNWRSCTDQHWLTGFSHFYPPFATLTLSKFQKQLKKEPLKKKKLLKNHTVYFSCSLPFTVYITFLCWCKECLVKCSFKSIIIHLFWKRNPLQKYTRNSTKSAYLWKRGLYNYIISVISQYLFPLSFSNSDKCSTIFITFSSCTHSMLSMKVYECPGSYCEITIWCLSIVKMCLHSWSLSSGSYTSPPFHLAPHHWVCLPSNHLHPLLL